MLTAASPATRRRLIAVLGTAQSSVDTVVKISIARPLYSYSLEPDQSPSLPSLPSGPYRLDGLDDGPLYLIGDAQVAIEPMDLHIFTVRLSFAGPLTTRLVRPRGNLLGDKSISIYQTK